MEERTKKPLFEKSIPIEVGKMIIGYKAMAYKDYKAARHLINSGFLHQGALLINTCLEKEIKAYLFVANIDVAKNHETSKLLNLLSTIENVNWVKDINPEFIKVISKIYKTRYFENLGPGFNFVINKNKFLAELDFTYSLLESMSVMTSMNRNTDNPFIKSRYQEAIKEKEEIIYLNNYILNNIPKEDFLNQPEMIYEFRIALSHHPVEGEYTISRNAEFTKFNYVGLEQTASNSFKFSQQLKDDPNSKTISFIRSKFS